jgi:hypothetical protein
VKAKILRISADALLPVLQGAAYVEMTLPEDAKIVAVSAPFDTANEIWLKIESEAYPDIKAGSKLEFMPPLTCRMFEDDWANGEEDTEKRSMEDEGT